MGAEEAPLLHRIKGPFSTWWQVKDSNLRSFRDGFTDQRRQAADQRKRLSGNNFRAHSAQTADASRRPPDTPVGNPPPRSRRRPLAPDSTPQLLVRLPAGPWGRSTRRPGRPNGPLASPMSKSRRERTCSRPLASGGNLDNLHGTFMESRGESQGAEPTFDDRDLPPAVFVLPPARPNDSGKTSL